MEAMRILVSGKVQGVGYRDWTQASARALGLTGWVRNLHGGQVEIFANGDSDAIAMLVEACRNGPAGARVDDVVGEPRPRVPDKDFVVRPTA